ncbi:hypothetical protein NO1_2129 [Candidatus Termititenax aidoneus]|uniref:Uncharacterized protein n=1 Tax=Termititenax aidoneus TaxID=2218524 RepID=A0A388TDQ3_TERA1|nr:hypothetical protein NO1_2129 [Candidatus Termititenax aidoneus]
MDITRLSQAITHSAGENKSTFGFHIESIELNGQKISRTDIDREISGNQALTDMTNGMTLDDKMATYMAHKALQHFNQSGVQSEQFVVSYQTTGLEGEFKVVIQESEARGIEVVEQGGTARSTGDTFYVVTHGSGEYTYDVPGNEGGRDQTLENYRAR